MRSAAGAGAPLANAEPAQAPGDSSRRQQRVQAAATGSGRSAGVGKAVSELVERRVRAAVDLVRSGGLGAGLALRAVVAGLVDELPPAQFAAVVRHFEAKQASGALEPAKQLLLSALKGARAGAGQQQPQAAARKRPQAPPQQEDRQAAAAAAAATGGPSSPNKRQKAAAGGSGGSAADDTTAGVRADQRGRGQGARACAGLTDATREHEQRANRARSQQQQPQQQQEKQQHQSAEPVRRRSQRKAAA